MKLATVHTDKRHAGYAILSGMSDIALTREPLLKRKAQYSLAPYTN